ncbi:MAG: class I SAM-dependent methyltransferase [Candidatus Omnitrophica bacterium]|nr:class I SAM-dependent methyltransferase [Candidatus Omnitrophota bacterium]
MVKTGCGFCDSDHLELITDEVRFGKKAMVYRCQDCGLTFLDQASFHFPEDFYEGDYHQTYLTHIEPDAVDPRKYFEKMQKTTQVWADRFTPMLTGSEIVLDVGCSSGHFMSLIKDGTKEIYGSELNKKEIAFCREELNLDVSDQPLEARFKEGMFDFITMIFVLEHIAEPKEFLVHLKKFLKPDGKLIILVPNVKDPLVSFYDLPEFRKFYYCIEHLFYYDQETIRKLFDAAGLKGTVDVVQEYPITNHINWAYTRGPSDVIAARRNVPNVPLAPTAPEEDWEKLWNGFNSEYQKFLVKHGYGDRLWCVVGK